MRAPLVLSALLLALMHALLAPAQAANKESWDFYKSADEAQLSYGVPESDIVTIVFRCNFKQRPIELVTSVLPAKPKKGAALRTTLTNGKVSASHDGKIGHHSEHGYHFEASSQAEPKLVEVLKSGTTLTISVPGGKPRRVPLKGVAKPLSQFESACLKR